MAKPSETCDEGPSSEGHAASHDASTPSSIPGDGAPSTPIATAVTALVSTSAFTASDGPSTSAPSPPASSEGSEKICLICHEPLPPEAFASGEALVLDCACRGDMALRHKSCAIKLTHLKGHTNCDVCKQPITNLPPIPPEVLEERQQEQQFAEAAGALLALLRVALQSERSRQRRREEARLWLKLLWQLLISGCILTFCVLTAFPSVRDALAARGPLVLCAGMAVGVVGFMALVCCLSCVVACGVMATRGEDDREEPLLGSEAV